MSRTIKHPLPVNGVDMRSQETALLKGTVREAFNVTIDREGVVSRRSGFENRVAGLTLHSLFYWEAGKTVFVADGHQLCVMDEDTFALTPVFNLGTHQPVRYTEFNSHVYFTNGQVIGSWLKGRASPSPVGVPIPRSPTLSVGAGALPPGRYAVSCSLTDAFGEEGGATPPEIIHLPNGGGIHLAQLPVGTGYTYNVYLTAPDGDVLRLAESFPIVFPSYLVGTLANGAVSATQGLRPMVAGEYITWHGGRLFTAKGDTVYFSQPMSPHLTDRAHNYIQCVGTIRFIASVGLFLIVADDQGVWAFEGVDPEQFKRSHVTEQLAVAGSSTIAEASAFDSQVVRTTKRVAVWLSQDGHRVFTNEGECIALNADRVQITDVPFAFSKPLITNGIKQIVSLTPSILSPSHVLPTDSVIE